MNFNGKDYKKRRKEAGLTQQDIWERTGIYATHVSRYETGKHKPLLCTITRLEEALK